MHLLEKLKILYNSNNKKKLILDYIWNGKKQSYSQCWEDLILDFFINKEKWLYVDVWTNDPIRWNNLYRFYKKWWSGINIEPNYQLYKKLLKKRKKDINLNIWIWNGEKLDFFVINPDTLSTFDQQTSKRYIDMWHSLQEVRKVDTLTLEKLFDTHLWDKTIDILSVDVEWFDMQVLQSNNWNKYKPKYIILETLEYEKDSLWKKQSNGEFDLYLEKRGYINFADTHINTIYKLK